jgi:transcriptional regulator with XRE-family HTH domain
LRIASNRTNALSFKKILNIKNKEEGAMSATQASTKAKKKNPNAVDKHVGTRVRMRRIILNMSQEKVGEAIGVTFQQVQKYEKGTNRIGASRLQQISEVLSVPVPFFFEGAPGGAVHSPARAEAGPLSDISDFLAASEGRALVKAFIRIKDRALRRRIVDLVEHIALP